MAQISDVMHASAVFDAARQELAWVYSSDFTGVPEPMKDAVHAISAVLNEAEMRWVTSTREEPMVAVMDKEKGMAVVVTGDGEKKKRVVKEVDTQAQPNSAAPPGPQDQGTPGLKNPRTMDTQSIAEAERRTKDWLLRLEEVAGHMRAAARKKLLGDYSKIDDKLSARWLPCLPRSTSRAARIAPPTIHTVAQELEKLKEQYHKEFGHSTGLPLALAATCTEQPACSSAAAGGQEEKDDPVKKSIIDILTDIYTRRVYNMATVVPIFGPPCVGKTRLAKSVFHDGSFGAGYYKVWVHMRKGWDIKEIHESIIELLRGHRINDEDNYTRTVKSEADYGDYIRHLLEDHERLLLLVFDNLVEEQDSSMLEKLLKFLQYSGDVIAMVTTRSEALAKYISTTRLGWDVKPYRLHPSSDDLCWEIIKRTHLEAAAAGTAVAVSEKVGREIASKCSRIPLAAKALGRSLQSVDPQDVWNIGRGFSRDSQQLPIHSATVFTHSKHSSSGILEVGAESWLSLAYCAYVFPKGKGHGVVTRDLLNQWCSLGITTRQRGASCISELLDRSLLFREKYASEDETDAASLLRMEDLMHDFARYLLGDRLIVVDGKNGATSSTSSPVNNKSSSAYLALVSNFDAKQLDISSKLPARILALRFEGCGEMELSDGGFASLGKYLRLLDLSGYSEKKMLSGFIRHLKQLRYLKAPGIQDQEFIRSISGLHELRYLILRGSCQLSDLTEALKRLSNLLHLDLSGCTGLKELPKFFGRLWRLEHLDLSTCSGIEALPESFCWLRSLSHLDMSRCSGLKALPESLGMLTSLRHLDLSRCSGLEALQALPTSFEHLTELRHLDLSGLSRIQALHMVSLPRELRHLNLSGCSGLQGKQLPDAREPFELRHLDLSGCSSVSYLPNSYALLKNLVHLNLSGCSSLIELPRHHDGWWARKLKHLDLSYCSQLREMYHAIIPDLRYLDLSGCSGLRDMLPIYQLERLQYLDLSGCLQLQVSSKSEGFLEGIRRNGGRASGPKDASLKCEL